jgi:hypothetical protein
VTILGPFPDSEYYLAHYLVPLPGFKKIPHYGIYIVAEKARAIAGPADQIQYYLPAIFYKENPGFFLFE